PGVAIFGTFDGQLVNRGERIALVTSEGQTIVSVDYSDTDGWPEEADGDGYSLEIINPLGNPDDPANWRRSAVFQGSPGQPNFRRPPGTVVIHAWRAAGPATDWIEGHSASSGPLDLSGWELTDFGSAGDFVFPAGALIEPSGWLVVQCDGEPNATGLHTF